MNTTRLSSIFILSALILAACNKVSYKKTSSGLAYKIYSGKGKDSLIKTGDVVKFNYSVYFNDSLMGNFNSYDKMAAYLKMLPLDKPSYDFREILSQLRTGDSLVTVQMADSLLKQGSPLLPPNAKNGDRLTTRIRIVDVFKVDSLAMADYNKEMERDRPRQLKQQEEESKKMGKAREDEFNKSYEELKKSGDVDREIAAMESFLAGKKVKAQKTGKGTYVVVKEPGSGPAVERNKYVLVKYTGKHMDRDVEFDSGEYPVQIGNFSVIPGWEEGLLLFKEGGKGSLYIPGFLAYGKTPRQDSPFRPSEPLYFDIEILKVSEEPIGAPAIH